MSTAFDKVDQLLYRLSVQGLQRITQASADELRALSQTAHNASLVRIERELEKINTYTQQYLARDPLFRMSAYMDAINHVWLLNRAARRAVAAETPSEALVEVLGAPRRVYSPVAEPLDLQPLAAEGWVTDTGFVGVSLYLRSAHEEGLLQISNARPTMHFGTDPGQLYGMSIGADKEESFRDLAHQAWRFTNAKRAPDGRLSVHQGLEVSRGIYLGAQAYQPYMVSSWRAILSRIQRAERSALPTHAPVFVLISPAFMGPLTLDQKRGMATALLKDQAGAEMTLIVPMRPENNMLIDNLEWMLTPPGAPQPVPQGGRVKRRKVAGHGPRLRPDALFGRASVAGDQLFFHPMTGIFEGAVTLSGLEGARVNEIHLSLEALRGARREARVTSKPSP
ncbi:hypothetical protein KKF91_14890 [Myxococcota bacterium]|nr:hypothetical protein [Myxococcota bacterium]MBU1897321.1 hypothetical protein [Myxococcota bacterium]